MHAAVRGSLKLATADSSPPAATLTSSPPAMAHFSTQVSSSPITAKSAVPCYQETWILRLVVPTGTVLKNLVLSVLSMENRLGQATRLWVSGYEGFLFLWAVLFLCLTPVFNLSSGSQRRRPLSLPVLTLIFPALLPCLVRDSLCTALQTKILWINWSLNAIDTIETWVSGNLTALTERSQPAIRWRVGEVANRVSCGSFRGGHWYLPIRNHDNRYFADWIRLCPGLSKNSENGNSCPKPHKAARMIEAVGRAVSIETETIIAIWILPRRSSRLYKGKLIKKETKMVKMDRE